MFKCKSISSHLLCLGEASYGHRARELNKTLSWECVNTHFHSAKGKFDKFKNLNFFGGWNLAFCFSGVPKDTFETFFLFRSVSEVSNYKAVNRPPQPLPGVGVNNPTNKPDLAYCALILTMILLKQHRTSPARHLPCYAATQFDQKIVNKYFPPNVFAKVKVHALRDCGWQIGFD